MERSRDRVQVWDWPLRLFHWTLVVAIAVAFLSSEEDSALNEWHVLSGWVAAVLIIFRIVWGFVGGEHSRFSDFVRPSRVRHHISQLARGERQPSLGHNPLGGVAVLILLALTAATIWTGGFGGEQAEQLHETLAWVLLAMVAVHVLAVVVMSVLERENLVRAMVTGDKPAARHPGAEDARAPGIMALLVAAVVVAATSYLIVRYDPSAFTPRSAESFEHRQVALGAAVDSGSAEEKRDDSSRHPARQTIS
jgi:cytochrome b